MTKTKWGIVGGGIAAGAALIPLIPLIKRRALRVTTILKKDHRLVSGLIRAVEKTPHSNRRIRETLFDQIRTNVLVHAEAEEAVLYPAMSDFMIDSRDSNVNDAYREHQRIKDLINDLSTMDPTTDAFSAKFAYFKSRLEHHVEEEESVMFKAITDGMSVAEQEQMGQRIHDRKVGLKSRLAA